MKRRLEIARGFLHTSKILFLDEPIANPEPAVDARQAPE
jgi:ABC-type multidrug transport system ATPase subunit